MIPWIEDDSSVIDAIQSARDAWFEAHPECSTPTTETTDEEINKALGLPATGALRPLSDEFADSSEEDVRSAVAAGLDSWWNRADVRYQLLIDYSAAPDATAFEPADIAELESFRAEIQRSEKTSHATEWSRASRETDMNAVTNALSIARSGQRVYAARDEDGFYFAAERA